VTRKQLEDRRRRNRELAERDARNRCPVCKRALGAQRIVVAETNQQVCSDACADELTDRSERS